MKNTSKILLIGGTSSIAPQLINKFLQEGYMITATYRNKDKSRVTSDSLYWVHLDLNSRRSVSDFVIEIRESEFDRVIVLIGSTFKLEYDQSDIEILNSYYTNYVSSINFLIIQSLARLKPLGNLVAFSSRAGSRPSYDVHYAAAKGALESLVQSIAPKLRDMQSVICIAPSLVEDSEMYSEMSQENIQKHKARSNQKLLTISEIVEFTFEMSPQVTFKINGRTIPLGADY